MPFSVKEIIELTGGRVVNSSFLGNRLDSIQVERPASLAGAQPSDLAFFFSRAFEHELPLANPGVLITGEPFVKPMEGAKLPFWSTGAVIACDDPYFALAFLSEKFAVVLSSVAHSPSVSSKGTQVHPSAIIAASAQLGEGVQIGAHCVIEENVRIGAGTVLYPGCYLGPKSILGKACVLFPNVTLYEWTELGDRVRIHSGSVLGSDGFGFAPVREGKKVKGHQKIYHLGRVIVGDDVELGANTCVDRGTFGETRIGNQSKLDNLVHVGHNSRLDEGVIICGGTCLAGNASVGKFAYIGGLTGITNHVHVGDGGMVGAVSLVTKDVAPRGTAVGNPQREHKEHFRAHALLNKLLVDRRPKR